VAEDRGGEEQRQPSKGGKGREGVPAGQCCSEGPERRGDDGWGERAPPQKARTSSTARGTRRKRAAGSNELSGAGGDSERRGGDEGRASAETPGRRSASPTKPRRETIREDVKLGCHEERRVCGQPLHASCLLPALDRSWLACEPRSGRLTAVVSARGRPSVVDPFLKAPLLSSAFGLHRLRGPFSPIVSSSGASVTSGWQR